MSKKCSSYVGVACVNGSCPNALREENPEYYADCYGTFKRQQCRYCGYNKGCEDCAIPHMDDNIDSEEQCRILHGMEKQI